MALFNFPRHPIRQADDNLRLSVFALLSMDDGAPKETANASNQSMITKLQIAVAIMVPFFGIINTWQSQYLQTQLQQVKQEAERKQQFAGSIQSQLNNLTGNDPTKAKVALASLYTLAREEGDKAILFTIAIVSQNEELKKDYCISCSR